MVSDHFLDPKTPPVYTLDIDGSEKKSNFHITDSSGMTYIEQIPRNQLHKFVAKIWYCQADNFANTTLAIPFLYHELIFNLSEQYSIRQAGIEIINPVALVNGIQTKPYIVHSSGKHEMIGVLFNADGLKAFTKYASSEFTDKFIDASLIFGTRSRDLMYNLHLAANPSEKITLVENFLNHELNTQGRPIYLNVSLSLLSRLESRRARISSVSRKISVTNKSLINAFQKHIGITPIKYVQILEVNSALSILSRKQEQSLTSLANHLNYYDQSHFIHSFKRVTGLTPTDYIKQAALKNTDTQFPNYISMVG